MTAMPLRESRAPPSSQAAQTQACSLGGGCRARQDWTGPGCPRTSPSPASSSKKPPAPWLALSRLCAQDPTGHGAQNKTQTRQLGWGRHKKPKTALAQPASPGLGLRDPLGPGTGGRRKPGRVGTYLARPRPNSEKDLPEHRKCWPGSLGGLGWTGPWGARERVSQLRVQSRVATQPGPPGCRLRGGCEEPGGPANTNRPAETETAFLLPLQPPAPGEGHASTQAHRLSSPWAGRHCLQGRGPRGRGHPGASSTSPGP